MFGKWAKGELRPRRDDDDDANIPVRVNGATVMMTRAEYDDHRAATNKLSDVHFETGEGNEKRVILRTLMVEQFVEREMEWRGKHLHRRQDAARCEI